MFQVTDWLLVHTIGSVAQVLTQSQRSGYSAKLMDKPKRKYKKRAKKPQDVVPVDPSFAVKKRWMLKASVERILARIPDDAVVQFPPFMVHSQTMAWLTTKAVLEGVPRSTILNRAIDEYIQREELKEDEVVRRGVYVYDDATDSSDDGGSGEGAE